MRIPTFRAERSELETEKVDCIKERHWQRFDEIWAEQAALGRPCFTFLHAYNEDTSPQQLLLHPQMLCDGMAVSEFGHLFLEHWQESA